MLLRVSIVYALLLSVALRLKGLAARPAGAPPAAPEGRTGVLRVLIVGATGGTGRQLVAQALERGHQVTALAWFR